MENISCVIDWIAEHSVILQIDNCMCMGIVLADRYVLTASHCITNKKPITAVKWNGENYVGNVIQYYTLDGRRIRLNSNSQREKAVQYIDLALVEFPQIKANPITFGYPYIMEIVYIPVPVPQNSDKSIIPLISRGRVVAIDTDSKSCYTDAYIIRGTSGAPLINQQGQLLGVATQLYNGNWSRCLILPSINLFFNLV